MTDYRVDLIQTDGYLHKPVRSPISENWTSPKNVRDSSWKEGPGIESGTGQMRYIEFTLHGESFTLRIWTFLGRAEFFDASADDPVATRKAIHQLRLVQQ